MQENADQNNSEYGHFLRSVYVGGTVSPTRRSKNHRYNTHKANTYIRRILHSKEAYGLQGLNK